MPGIVKFIFLDIDYIETDVIIISISLNLFLKCKTEASLFKYINLFSKVTTDYHKKDLEFRKTWLPRIPCIFSKQKRSARSEENSIFIPKSDFHYFILFR